jgi:hypothetical protein
MFDILDNAILGVDVKVKRLYLFSKFVATKHVNRNIQ